MYPELYRLLATRTLTLGDLILVMREDQVDATGMNVKLLAKVLRCHCGALDMPAREAYAPGTGPVHLPAGLSVFPQGEIFRRVLIFGYLHLLATMSTCPQILNRVA